MYEQLICFLSLSCNKIVNFVVKRHLVVKNIIKLLKNAYIFVIENIKFQEKQNSFKKDIFRKKDK